MRFKLRRYFILETYLLFGLVLIYNLAGSETIKKKYSNSIQNQYSILSDKIHSIGVNKQDYWIGGQDVLDVAYYGLKELHQKGKDPLVDLVDLWSLALMQGIESFRKPDLIWGILQPQTVSLDEADTLVGPWRLSMTWVIFNYGTEYGYQPGWSLPKKEKYFWKHPEVQAKIAADFIQDIYANYGKRSPYALQSYYSLDLFLTDKIGKGPWSDPIDMAQKFSGFAGKQILLGNNYNVHGLLYWLWTVGDLKGVRETLMSWQNQSKWVLDDTVGYRITDTPGNFGIKIEDLIYCNCHPEYKKEIKKIIYSLRK